MNRQAQTVSPKRVIVSLLYLVSLVCVAMIVSWLLQRDLSVNKSVFASTEPTSYVQDMPVSYSSTSSQVVSTYPVSVPVSNPVVSHPVNTGVEKYSGIVVGLFIVGVITTAGASWITGKKS